MNKKSLQDTKSFFLDSGVIIDLLRTDLTGSTQPVKDRIELTHKFFECLDNPQLFGSVKKHFMVSALTIAEIFHIENGQPNTLEAVISLFNTQEVEIYSFDEETAIFHNSTFESILSQKEIDELKKMVNYPISKFSGIKDRIRKDILILTTAKLNKSDIILTNDSGFFNLCDRLDMPCHLFTDRKEQFRMSQNNELIYGFL